jgi:Arc/MetJ-type ribon-helix-helix transcriptional regulator
MRQAGVFPKLARTAPARYRPTMNIALDKDVEDFLEAQVRAGVCSAPGEWINNLVRSIREQGTFRVTPELEAWLLEAADQPSTPLTSEDFASIRARVKARITQAQP